MLFLAAGLALGVALLGPYFVPDENQQARQRLEERLQAWTGIQDLQAEMEVLRAGEPALRLKVLALVGLAVRLEIHAPQELAGEVYALRAVPQGWLLVHFRPALSLGLEARFPENALVQLLGGLGTADLRKVQVSWPEENVVLLSGLSGPFPNVEIHFGLAFALPERVVATDAHGQRVEVWFGELQINQGLELRELLLLDPLPNRWIPIPIPAGGA